MFYLTRLCFTLLALNFTARACLFGRGLNDQPFLFVSMLFSMALGGPRPASSLILSIFYLLSAELKLFFPPFSIQFCPMTQPS